MALTLAKAFYLAYQVCSHGNVVEGSYGCNKGRLSPVLAVVMATKVGFPFVYITFEPSKINVHQMKQLPHTIILSDRVEGFVIAHLFQEM